MRNFHRISFLLFLALSLCNNSCSYQFGDDYFLDLEQIDPSAKFELDLDENEVLRTSKTINFNFDSNNIHRLYFIQFSVDGKSVHFSNDATGSFLLDINELNGNEHILEVTFQFSSGTGSLADANNLEQYQGKQQYSFKTDKSSPKDVVLNSIELIEGSPVLKWTLTEDPNFQSGYLTIYTNGYFSQKISLTREEISSLSFTDRETTTLDFSYTLTLINYYGESTSNLLRKKLSPPDFSLNYISDSSFEINYERHPLYGNFDELSFNFNSIFDNKYDKNGGSFKVNEPFLFGSTRYIQVSLFKSGNYIDSFSIPGVLGKEFNLDQIHQLVFDQESNFYFAIKLIGDGGLSKDLFLYKLDPYDFSIVDYKKINRAPYSFADCIIESGELVISTMNETLFINPNDLSTEKILFPPNDQARSYYRAGNYFSIMGQNIEIYNSETKDLLGSLTQDYRFFFSEDGQTFINGDKLYKIENNKIIFLTSLNNGTPLHFATFIPEKDQILLGNNFNSQNSILYSIKTEKRISLNISTNINFARYDTHSEKIYVHQRDHSLTPPEKIIILDSNTFQIKTLNCEETQHGMQYFFVNNNIFTSDGSYLEDYF